MPSKSFFTIDLKCKRVKVLLSIFCALLIVLTAKIVYIVKLVNEIPPGGRMIFSSAIETNKVFEKEGRKLLWGGNDESQHFEITQTRLNPERLQYGLGREYFAALIEPQFVPAHDANEWLPDDERILLMSFNGEVKVYPIPLVRRHEVVNDVIGGKPIFAAYCILADLGAVYERTINSHVFTFALSGYTYSEPNVWDGLNAFVLWDRETESLWWPPIGKGVSGSLMDVSLPLLDEQFWSQTRWGVVKAQYPNASVLDYRQSFTPPSDWKHYDENVVDSIHSNASASFTVAPRWGENSSIGEKSGSTTTKSK